MDKTLFDLYTDYLLSSFGQVSATTLSRLVDGAVSHDQITRMLARPPQHSPQSAILGLENKASVVSSTDAT